MTYNEWAEQIEKMPYRVKRGFEDIAEELYQYAVENEDLPEEFVNMLNGVAKACEIVA